MRRFRTGDHAYVREMNISSVLRYIYTSAPISRSKIANLTGLNKSTVSSLVADLIARELVYEVGIMSSRMGRPATLLEINPSAGCVVGVELSVDYITTVLTGFRGDIYWRCSINIDPDAPQDLIVTRTLELVDDALLHARGNQQRLIGIGLALPGMVDVERGTLHFSPNLQWRDVPLGEILSAHCGLPVIVDNDANAAALGEHLFGVARQASDFIFVVAGVGIGGGLFLNGQLYRGSSGIAGEIGHTMITTERSLYCRCGNRGCWENLGNQFSLIERVRARLEVGRQSLISELISDEGLQLSLELIARAAESGDNEVLSALDETGKAIGLGIANLVNVFDPQIVVFGGSMSVVAGYLIDGIRSVVQQRSLDVPRPEVKVMLSAFGSDASVIGAIALVIESCLEDPTRIDIVGSERV